jgi:hypothetical protein
MSVRAAVLLGQNESLSPRGPRKLFNVLRMRLSDWRARNGPGNPQLFLSVP